MATKSPSFESTPTASVIDVSGGSNATSHSAAEAAKAFTGNAQDAGAQAKDAVQKVGGQAKAALGDLHGKAQEVTGDLREQAIKMKDQALDQARSAATEGKTKAADTIHGVAGDLREAASKLGQNPTIAPVAKYGTQAADALEDFSGTLRNKDVDQLVTEVSGFVRRNPAIAVGIAVAAGFALTQLLKGGSTNVTRSDDDRHSA